MMRWLAPASLAACAAACIYGNDIDDEWEKDSERMSCMANWDCYFEGDVCGSIISQDNQEACPDEQGWLGVESWNLKWGDDSFDDEDAVRFTCIDSFRYFPVCTQPDKRECDGESCPDEFACAIKVGDADKKSYCVSLTDQGEACSAQDTSACLPPHDVCVRFFEYTESATFYHANCVSIDAFN